MICRHCSRLIEPCQCHNDSNKPCPWHGFRHVTGQSHFCKFLVEMAEPDPEFHTFGVDIATAKADQSTSQRLQRNRL